VSGANLRCGRCSSVISDDDLRCPICNLTTPVSKSVDRANPVVDILRCSGCGAAMTYQVAKRAAACAFCGSVLDVEHPADPMEEAEDRLPFTVDSTQARHAFAAWLGTLGWFRPGDLRTGARLETIQPLRWVGWVFDARAELSWTADTDADTRQADWAPHSGTTELNYDDVVVPATRGLNREEVAILLPSYDLASRSEGTDLVDDATVERFDVPRSTARIRLVEAVDGLARRRLGERHLPGRRVRNLRIATILRGLEARRVTFPAWVLAYRYKDRLYRTVLSGQDASCLKGEAPYSVARIAAVVAGGVALIALLALLGIIL
jgi:DNA-directed RNA polymerase subunit RPC12/RpoP